MTFFEGCELQGGICDCNGRTCPFDIKKGDRYIDGQSWASGGQGTLLMEVIRVARDRSWADIRVVQPHTNSVWTKRQPTPIPGRKVS